MTAADVATSLSIQFSVPIRLQRRRTSRPTPVSHGVGFRAHRLLNHVDRGADRSYETDRSRELSIDFLGAASCARTDQFTGHYGRAALRLDVPTDRPGLLREDEAPRPLSRKPQEGSRCKRNVATDARRSPPAPGLSPIRALQARGMEEEEADRFAGTLRCPDICRCAHTHFHR